VARLSQRAMNNVVILAMLVMIALFNLDKFASTPDAPSSRSLLPSDAYVLKIEQDGHKLERNGQTWRQVSGRAALPVTPQAQYAAWQQAALVPTPLPDSALSQVEPIITVVWLAGYSQGIVFAFYPSSHPTTVKLDGQWYALENAELRTLLPWLSFADQ